MIAGMMIMYLNHIFFIYVLYLIYYTQITVAYNSGTDCRFKGSGWSYLISLDTPPL